MNDMTEMKKHDLGPQELAAAEKSPFLLSQAEWYAIQRYVKNALLLPDTETKMRKSLGVNANEPYAGPFNELQQLLEGYQKVVPHVEQWETHIFPETVNLAQSISHYALKAKIIYGALQGPIDALITNPDDQKAKDDFAAKCNKIAEEASDNEERASKVFDLISEFAKSTDNDKVMLDELYRVYEGKLGQHSEARRVALAERERLKVEIAKFNKEYEHACIVAETTPTYAWLGLFGLIAASIVAGIYGKEAVRLKKAIDKDMDDAKTLDIETQRADKLISTLDLAKTGLAGIKEQIIAALPCIQKIKSTWNAIAGDLKEIGHIIQTDIVEEDLLKELGIGIAIEQWLDCKVKADAYLAHAFIAVVDDPK